MDQNSNSDESMGKRLQEQRHRLRAPGRTKKMSQAEAAKLLRVSRVRLASYEGGFVPLNFWVGWEMCRLTCGSQLWLATGAGPAGPFLDLRFDAGQWGITDRTGFLDGIVRLWEALTKAAVAKGIAATELPAKPEWPPVGARIRPVNRVATGRIRVTTADRSAGQLRVMPEYLAGCANAGLPTKLLLTHPGVEAVDFYLSTQRQGSRAGLRLLRDSLPPAARHEDFLRKLDPFFLCELKLAVLKLVGIHSAD